ncbi:hypothetical protein H257_18528 [Aphanomyces astaci]|uniref:subtilisin n=1 Tax=Aphanomyces astaci TaxID=112090 RepID=W4FAU3_APHAT|nr:hypothetical protein H257_18528 [Aphanomyces astaci]ETV64605.1 hypothetical protein H257_18528 [Aphanomyces astaci]|eukprot:XP_009845913.1 hypothetical protein H257_18528 [Aphanomyces astaci]
MMVQYRFVALATAAVTAKISVQVHRNLEVAKLSNVVVKFDCDEAHVNHRRRLKDGASRSETIESVVDSLKEHTTTSQASVKSLLANQVGSMAVDVATTWIDCSMYIDNASNDLVDKIAALPQVESIYEPVARALDESISDDQPASAVDAVNQWGIDKIQAPELWAKGIKGDGIVVGIIDSGVRYTHKWLKSNWRQEYGWFDPYKKTELPNDQTGHGTRAVGTIAGTQGIGVAPNAQWIACKGWNATYLEQHMLVQCAQFMLCPHDKDGNNRNCSKAPHVINNSWGKYTKNFWMEDTIAAWREAGIIPVFSNGNTGLKGCAYSSYPAASPHVIAVGFTDSSDFLSPHSSLGPSVENRYKPDISAPGVGIRSASSVNDVDDLWGSGSSTASPHVSGAIALYLSANEGASYDQVYTALTNNVDTDTLSPPNKSCGDIPNTQYPNNLFGYGRLNIFNAVSALPSVPARLHPIRPASVPGSDVKAVSQRTADDCCDECRNTPNCNAFTFTQDNGGTCWLKDEDKPVNWVIKEGSKSARVLNPTNYLTTCGSLEDDTHYAGGDFASTNQATAESCCGDCENTPGCTLFGWSNHSGGTCWLKDTKGLRVTLVGAKAGFLLAGPSSCGAVESNVDFVGENVAQVSADQAADCCAACHSHQACNAYSWLGGVCYLKGRRAETKVLDGVVSARVDKCSALETDVYYAGKDLSEVKADVADCCAICRETSDCGAFSWTNGVCYLKFYKAASQANATFISAVVI